MFPEVQRGLFGFLTEELVICMHLVSDPPIFQGKLVLQGSVRTDSIAVNKCGGQSWQICLISSADTGRVYASPGS